MSYILHRVALACEPFHGAVAAGDADLRHGCVGFIQIETCGQTGQGAGFRLGMFTANEQTDLDALAHAQNRDFIVGIEVAHCRGEHPVEIYASVETELDGPKEEVPVADPPVELAACGADGVAEGGVHAHCRREAVLVERRVPAEMNGHLHAAGAVVGRGRVLNTRGIIRRLTWRSCGARPERR